MPDQVQSRVMVHIIKVCEASRPFDRMHDQKLQNQKPLRTIHHTILQTALHWQDRGKSARSRYWRSKAMAEIVKVHGSSSAQWPSQLVDATQSQGR